MSENVRNVLLRALFEPEFYNLLLTDVDAALVGYDLSDEERRAVQSPSRELYGMIKSTESTISLFGKNVVAQPPTTTTTTTTVVAVVIVVAIVAFVAAVANTNNEKADIEALRPLIDAIKTSRGAERMNLVTTLVNELTKEG